jgi:dimethylargininase
MIALTRDISTSVERCELTHLARTALDVDCARAEHDEYERALGELGCDVHRLATTADLPDSVFIEDTAVVFDELAIVARPGAASRREETVAVAEALARYRPLVRIAAPATLDGGDVLVVARHVFVGISGRTNLAAVEQMRYALAPHGYQVDPASVHGCLHLKSAVTAVADRLLLVNRSWIDVDLFGGFDLIDIDASEPFGANALRIGDTVIYPEEHSRTARILEGRGMTVRRVPAGELAKAEGGVTCCVLLVA